MELAQDRVQCRGLVLAVLNLRVLLPEISNIMFSVGHLSLFLNNLIYLIKLLVSKLFSLLLSYNQLATDWPARLHLRLYVEASDRTR
jgi:hypothetical protein